MTRLHVRSFRHLIFTFSSGFGLHQHLREICGYLAARFSNYVVAETKMRAVDAKQTIPFPQLKSQCCRITTLKYWWYFMHQVSDM